jgi:hypothetical protein
MRERDGTIKKGNRFGDIGWVQLDADIFSAETLRHQTNGSRPEEWIQHELARLRSRENAWLDESLGKRRDV